MDALNLCWRGMAGSGKRTALRNALQTVAALRGVPFSITTKCLDGTTAAGGDEEGDGDAGATAAEQTASGQILMESSLVHIGLDIARMSMQDKQVLRPILLGFGQGSHVLAGAQGRGARILVLYHAHLLSSESVLLLQACLEQNEGDVSVWLTSELPVSQRIRDWFVEIPVAGEDHSFETYRAMLPHAEPGQPPVANWSDVFTAVLSRWRRAPPPTIRDIQEVKGFVYELLMRNLRWVEATHCLMDTILQHPELSLEQRQACIRILAKADATAGGYTIPSYRIPILWEHLFLQFRSALSTQPVSQVDDSAPSRGVGESGPAPTEPAAAPVARRGRRGGRSGQV